MLNICKKNKKFDSIEYSSARRNHKHPLISLELTENVLKKKTVNRVLTITGIGIHNTSIFNDKKINKVSNKNIK